MSIRSHVKKQQILSSNKQTQRLPDVYILEPILVKKPWGISNDLFEKVTNIIPHDTGLLGEIWYASAQQSEKNKCNVVQNYKDGSFTIHDLISDQRENFLGTALSYVLEDLPKLGKTESWYVREVRGRVKIVNGVKPSITREKYEHMVRDGYFHQKLTIDMLERDLITTTMAIKGDMHIVKPGTLHTVWALDDDAYVALDEVQQGFGNNRLPTMTKVLLIKTVMSLQVHPHDTHVQSETRPNVIKQYAVEPSIRVSDFGRGRDIQPELTPELIDYGHVTSSRTTPLEEHIAKGVLLTHLLIDKNCAKIKLEIAKGASAPFQTNGERYYIMNIIQGALRVITRSATHDLITGNTIAIPANLGSYTLTATEDAEVFIDFIPDLQERISYLESKGFSASDIRKLDGECFENDLQQAYYEREKARTL